MFRLTFVAVMLAMFLRGGQGTASAGSSVADVDAALRSGGNRKEVAAAIGRTLFATRWPAQLVKVRVDGVGAHNVAGLLISGVKFHARIDAATFTSEIVALVRQAFAASDIEEVDVWATVPLAVMPREVVGGEYAQPTARIVYGVTVVRAELPTFAARLQRGDDVFWDAAWRSALARQVPFSYAPGKG